MFKFIGFAVAVVLGIICGNQIADALDSGLVGFVGGFVCFIVFGLISRLIGGFLDEGVDSLNYWTRRRQLYGKSKYVNLR